MMELLKIFFIEMAQIVNKMRYDKVSIKKLQVALKFALNFRVFLSFC